MTQKTWLRPTQISRTFPPNKYGFTHHLRQIGDWVETQPLDDKGYNNINDAAHFWAWRRGWRVTVLTQPDGEGKKIVRITLIAKHRERDYG